LIKDEFILGVNSLEKPKYSLDQKIAVINNSRAHLNNMNEYWHEFESQIKVTNNSLKESDLKLMKMLIIEKMLPEYSAITLANPIKKIIQ
jgi:hypothetical protein